MQIGEPIRRIVVEPLAPPVSEPQKEPEQISAAVRYCWRTSPEVTAIPDYISPITGYRVWQWVALDCAYSLAKHGYTASHSKRNANFPGSCIGGATAQNFVRMMLRILTERIRATAPTKASEIVALCRALD